MTERTVLYSWKFVGPGKSRVISWSYSSLPSPGLHYHSSGLISELGHTHVSSYSVESGEKISVRSGIKILTLNIDTF